jgi:PilZ domain
MRSSSLERRAKLRRQLFKFGTIRYDEHRIVGVVKNLSTNGALIEVRNGINVPSDFVLALEGDLLTRHCRVAWKTAKQIAVKFR